MINTKNNFNDSSHESQHDQHESEVGQRVIQIPRSSFTGSRLLNSTPFEINLSTSTVFLGKIPDTWIKLSSTHSIHSNSKSSRHSLTKWIPSTASNIRQCLTYTKCSKALQPGLKEKNSHSDGSHCHEFHKDMPLETWGQNSSSNSSGVSSTLDEDEICSATSDVKPLDSKNFDSVLFKRSGEPRRRAAREEQAHQQRNLAGGNAAETMEQLHAKNFFQINSQPNSCESKGALEIQANSSSIQPNSCNRPQLADGRIEGISEANDALEDIPLFRLLQDDDTNSDKRGLHPRLKDRPSLTVVADHADMPLQTLRKGRHDSGLTSTAQSSESKGDSKRLKVQFANPQFEGQKVHEQLQREYIIAEREHYRAVQKMQMLARKSRETTRDGKSKLRIKFVDRILRKRKIGEVIRADKMLVMIRKISDISTVVTLTERNYFDSFVEDHWREYYVVLKHNGSSENPLRVELFESHKGGKHQGKPDHSFNLNDSVRADFFSYTDKTISVSKPVQDGLRIFILNTKYPSVAFDWLFIIKEMSQVDFFSVAKINFAGESLEMRFEVPADLLNESFSEPELIKLYEQLFGYRMEYDALLAYLFARINSCIQVVAERGRGFHQLFEQNCRHAFCFRFRDRLEWVPQDGKSLILRSQLLGEAATLEYTQVKNLSKCGSDSEKNSATRPVSIEGFLSRITNIMGKEFSKFRAFYKIQYFFTSENILFFSSVFRGVPPSPNNAFVKENTDRATLCALLPDVYSTEPYKIDCSGHFIGLAESKFETFENEAVEEYSRKIRQIVSARAILDMRMISVVRRVPFEKIQPRHLYLQSYLWYSSPSALQDMNVIDSCFEIELFDGSLLKLLAPSRSIRDEWVERLNKMADFWRTYQAKLFETETSGNFQNSGNSSPDTFCNVDEMEVRSDSAYETGISSMGDLTSTYVLCSGYLYQKPKKHSSFSRYFVLLCPGYFLIYTPFKRSKVPGVRKTTPYFERYMTIPISECYVYSGDSSQNDLIGSRGGSSSRVCNLPRIYPDGLKSSEEEFTRCFSIWFGGKRALRHGSKGSNSGCLRHNAGYKNPSFVHLTRTSGITGKIFVFLARSKQERERWVHNISQEIDRFYTEGCRM